MGYAILLVVMGVLYLIATCCKNVLQCIVDVVINKAASRDPPINGSTPAASPVVDDFLCTYCTRQFHDGGHHCKCGAWTSSSGYRICHHCAAGGGPFPRCESCGQFY